MRAVIQRVDHACVRNNNRQEISFIKEGILIFVGVAREDTEADANYILEKAVNLRIFEDDHDKMNKSLQDVDGEMMVVSQFTLLGDCEKGRRPSFARAEEPVKAKEIYEYFVAKAKEKVRHVATGIFQEMMKVELVNNGPVTIQLDSRKNE